MRRRICALIALVVVSLSIGVQAAELRTASVALPSLSVLISSTLWPSAARTVKTVLGMGSPVSASFL